MILVQLTLGENDHGQKEEVCGRGERRIEATFPQTTGTRKPILSVRCGNSDNAERNASQVIAQHGVKLLLSQASRKEKKTRRMTQEQENRGGKLRIGGYKRETIPPPTAKRTEVAGYLMCLLL